MEIFKKGICSLAVENCKADCESALKEFKRNFKICFGIPSSLSLDELLEKSKSSSEDHLCYDEMRKLAEKYKFQSLGKKDLRSDLKSEDIVRCEEIEQAGTLSALNAFRKAVCQLGRQEKRRLEEEERRREAREEAKREEKQRLKEEKRLREEELVRKRKEEARRIEEVARQIKKDRMRLAKLESSQRSSTTPAVLNSPRQIEDTQYKTSKNKVENRTSKFDKKKGESKESEKEEDKNNNLDNKQEVKKKESKAEDKDSKTDKTKKADKEDEKLKAEEAKKGKKQESNNKKDIKEKITSNKTSVNKRKKNKIKNSSREKLNNKTRVLKKEKSLNNSSKLKFKKRSKSNSNLKTQKLGSKFKSEDIKSEDISKANNKQNREISDGVGVNISGSLTGNKLNVSDNIKVAQASSSGSCPVRMPDIEYINLYQSVLAPQIESMSKQDSQPFNNYDVVLGKPAGVIVRISHKPGSMSSGKDFGLALKISGSNELLKRCFHRPFTKEIYKYERGCYFKKANLKKDGYFKFFPLPMEKSFLSNNNYTYRIKARIYLKKEAYNLSCYKTKEFDMKVIYTNPMTLGFTRINGGTKCYEFQNVRTGYDPTSIKTVKGFTDSEEVKSKLLSMFPVSFLRSYTVSYLTQYSQWDYVKGVCDNSRALKRPRETVGLLSDIDELEDTREEFGYQKLIAIVPESYFYFHNILDKKGDPPAGVVIRPKWEYRRFLFFWKIKESFLGGSWNVAFIREDQKNTGTVAHELAHTLGQGREFYENHKTCRQIQSDPFEYCQKYKIPGGLDSFEKGQKYWKFVKNKYSIMSNVGKSINDLWIDRDTYQKTFKVLSQRAIIPKTETNFLDRSYRKKSLKAIVSGFYHIKENKFVAPKIRVHRSKLFTPSFNPFKKKIKFNVLTFKLKEGDTTLKKISRPIIKREMRLFYKNKAPLKRDFEFSPVKVVFQIPMDYKKRNLKILVLDSLGNRINSFKIPKKEEPQRKIQEKQDFTS